MCCGRPTASPGGLTSPGDHPKPARQGQRPRSSQLVSFPDERDYLSLARNLADSGAFSLDGDRPTAFRPPGFPAFLSVTAWFDDSLRALRVANALLLGGVVLVTGLTARRLSTGAAGVLAAAVVALTPVTVFTASKLYPQTLATLLLVASVAVVLAVERVASSPSQWRRSVLLAGSSGLLLAALTLTVPNHGVVLVVAVGWLGWRLRRAAVMPVLVLLVAFAIPIAAWGARNQNAFGEFVPISTNSGVNLLLGNNDGAGGGTGTNVDVRAEIVAANRSSDDEVGRDRYLRDRAVDWIVADPVRWARLYLAKVVNAFAVREDLATDAQERSTAQTILVAVTYLPVLALFLVRPFLVRMVPFRRGEGLLIGVFWANVLATAVAFTRIRFRVPLDPLMVVVVAILVVGLCARWVPQWMPEGEGAVVSGTGDEAQDWTAGRRASATP